MVSTALALVFALLSPIIWGFMNIMDKFVIEHKVKSAFGFAVIAGSINLVIGVILALLLDWSGITISALFFPALAGVLFGSQFFLYYKVLQKMDVSNMMGFIYFSPVVVALLSFLFLNEVLPLIGYVGACMIIIGVVLLSTRTARVKSKAVVWMVLSMILVSALYEFFIKVSTTQLPEMNGVAVNCLSIGIVVVPALLSRSIRRQFVSEIGNAKWSLFIESLTFINVVVIYFAMSGLPATIVSSVAATQPLMILLLERIFHKLGIRLCEKESFAHKIVPLVLIVLGVIILYSQEILRTIT